MSEMKENRFRRIAGARVNKIINMLKLLGNCSHTGNYSYSPESLKSKDELMHWLVEHGANHLQLMDFCSDYMAKYCNELCWQYPISDGKHLGTYIVLVKEGVLSLPYPKHNHSDSKSEKGIQNE